MHEVSYEDVLRKKHPLAGHWRQEVFKNENPIILELGCGKGEYTVGMARLHPDKNFIGVDIKGARIWKGAKTALEEGLQNVHFLRAKIDFIESFFDAGEVYEIWVTFPDPQPQDSREKKRLTSQIFFEKYKLFLVKDGFVNLKTDSTFLYDFSVEKVKELGYEVLIESGEIYSELDKYGFTDVEKDILQIKTHYEQMFTKKGHKISYLKVRPK